VEDGFFGVQRLAVAVGCYAGVEEAGEGVLAGWAEVVLAFDHDQIVGVEGAADCFEVGWADVFQVGATYFCSEGPAGDGVDCDS
jgi:hypothetical protein